MPSEPSAAILNPLSRSVLRQTGSGLSDTQLLENFVTRHDEPSFEVLVWRHGAMVLAVCTRVLGDPHEAEDAFQATFLVFARKAGSIGRGEVVAAWLYKVAFRVALRLRSAAAKRPASGAMVDEVPAPEPADVDWADLGPVLDDEIARLPEKYRTPLVLCHLEGRTNEEAAAMIGCPKGTILSRLSRGRERLRARLARRGVTLTATALAFYLTQSSASAAVPPTLVPATVGASVPFAAGRVGAELVSPQVAALAEGVLHAMTVLKVKVVAAAALVLALVGTGVGWAARAEQPVRPERANPARPAPNAPGDERRDRERPAPVAASLTGRVVGVAKDGHSFTVEVPPTERGGEPSKAEVKFGAKATVTYNGVAPNAAAPREGYQAQVWFEPNSKEVAATVAFNGPETARRGPNAVGHVASVAQDGKSFVLEVNPGRGERGVEPKRETIAFDGKTVLAFSSVGPDGARIVSGQYAQVWFTDDGKTAGKVTFSGTAEARARDEKAADATGTVVRADGKMFAIHVPAAERGAEPTRMTFELTDKTGVSFHNVPLDGAKLAPDLQAQVWLAAGSKTDAAKVRFTGTVPERWTVLTGKVVAVAKDGSSVTLETPAAARGEEPKRTAIKLTAKTGQSFFGVGPGEAKLAEGLIAHARLLDGSADTAAQVSFFKGGERGERGR
jgi:RNA polymerase sigma factor (sigma-70 family)